MARKSTSKLFPDTETETKEIVNTETKELDVPKDVSVNKLVDAKHESDVEDLDLSFLKRKRFRINGDDDKILELNPTDMSITIRLNESYPKLNRLMDEAVKRISEISTKNGDDFEAQLRDAAETLKDIDKKMRDEIDYLFDANVSEVCAPDGSMWDPVEGAFRYEHIIERLSALYEHNIDREFEAMKRKVENRATKYATVKKYHK